jgi:hypothetical protein
VGPSFATKRQEASEVWTQLGAQNPMIWGAAGDLVIKSMDVPYAEQIAERLKQMMKATNPAIAPALEEGEDGAALPPEVVQKLAEADQMMQQVQQQGQLVQQAGAEVEGQKAEVEKQLASLDLKKAQFEADYQRKVADIIKREAEAGVSEGQGQVESDRQALSAQLAEALAAMQQQFADYMTQSAAVIADIQARTQPNVVVPPPARIARIESQRINGVLVAIPVYEDQA